MDAVRLKVEGAQHALTSAIAKANLVGDPMGQALEAMSLSLGAQLALHEARSTDFRRMVDRLDQAVAEAVERGQHQLEERREVIVQRLVPQLADAATRSVRSWNRTITARALLTAGGVVAALVITAGCVCYGAGWKAGQVNGIYDKGALAGAVAQAGPDAEAALVRMVRDNNLPAVIATCQAHAYQQDARRACVAAMWLDPPPLPNKPAG